jgi:decaprenylphospho-beta-D-ribofuranose 2-oxidase
VGEPPGVRGGLARDPATGLVKVLGGTSLDDLLRVCVPQGWFLPVTPGTKFVTVGGAIASDVHGKDHHVTGTFGSHVRALTLALPDGSTRELTPDGTPDEFWATCGGMGLTGTIVDATVALHPIETSRILVDTDRTPDLDSLLVALADGESRYRYSVAWIDLLARGAHLGRSVLLQGRFAPAEAVEARQGRDLLAYRPPSLVPAPPAPSGLVNRWTIKAFNEVWYRKFPKKRRDELQTIESFFYPLDMLDHWPRIYGPKGFLQWQCLLPYDREDVLRQVIDAIAGSHSASFLAVLKRFGDANPGPLSFPARGWTLNLDMPAGDPELARLLRRLDGTVAEAGGSIYLAKDSCLDPRWVPVMYPRLDEWRAVRDRLDPERRLTSDLARRLHLV